MKIELQLFPMTIITTRVVCKHIALLSPTCVVSVTPPLLLLPIPRNPKAHLLLCVCVRGRVGSVGASRYPPSSVSGQDETCPTDPSGESAGSRWEVREVRFCQAVDWC